MKNSRNSEVRILFFFRIKMILFSVITMHCGTFSQSLAEGQNKWFGCCIGDTVPASFTSYWNQVTPENAGKWGSVEVERNIYQWGALDSIYNYAKAHRYPFRFHVLVWAKQQPEWLKTLAPKEQAKELDEWMRLCGERYPDADYVEVVNEAVEFPPYDYYPFFYKALGGEGKTGADWVIWAFEHGRKYFPKAKLLLNEYNILSEAKPLKKFLHIVNLLKKRNLVDGICEQAHYFAIQDVPLEKLRANLDVLAKTGLPIQITEFEIDEANDSTQLEKYKVIFPVLWEHPAVEGITAWGYIQGKMWKENGCLVRVDGTERPALQWLRRYIAEVPPRKQAK